MSIHLILHHLGAAIVAAETTVPAVADQVHTEPAAPPPAPPAEVGSSPIGASIALVGAMIGASYGIGRIVVAAIEGVTRQPAQAGKLQTLMILGIAFLEPLVLIVIIFAGLPMFLGS
jgi:F-type H+-transporting ATPase subunit c